MQTRISIVLVLLVLALGTSAQKPIRIVFNVDVSGYDVAAAGMHLAGQFATDGSTSITTDWNPADPASEMIPINNGKYTIRVLFPSSSAGLDLQFQFVRNDIWNDGTDYSEGTFGVTYLNYNCGVDDNVGGLNRIITIPSYNATFSARFEHCGKLAKASLKQEESDVATATLSVYPNPSSDQILVEGLNNDVSAKICDIAGRVLWSGNINAATPLVDVTSLPSGSYFLHTEDGTAIRFNVVK